MFEFLFVKRFVPYDVEVCGGLNPYRRPPLLIVLLYSHGFPKYRNHVDLL